MLMVKAEEGTRALIRDGVRTEQRSIFVITSDKPHDLVAKLYFVFREKRIKSDRISHEVLWCYGDNLVLPSCKINDAEQLESLRYYHRLNPETGPPFSLFRRFKQFTSCRYQDSERILGNRFGMCVLQDLEALTPDLIARTIETVDLGGLVILLIPSSANVRERFPTSGAVDKRFLLSLASCRPYIVMDDKLKLLPISSQPQPEEDVGVGLRQDFTRLTIHPYNNCPPCGTMDTDP